MLHRATVHVRFRKTFLRMKSVCYMKGVEEFVDLGGKFSDIQSVSVFYLCFELLKMLFSLIQVVLISIIFSQFVL